MRRIMWVSFFLIALFITMGRTGRAQSLGTISGSVLDPSGSGIPNAAVTVINEKTNLARAVKANEKGEYSLTLLPPSVYTLSAEAPGFKKLTRQHIELQVDQTLTVDANLEVGSTTETTTVSATAPLVDTMTGTISEVVDQQRMLDLPLNGRNAAALTTLVAGSTSANSEGAFQASTFGNQKVGGQAAAVAISVNGGSQTGINYQLDGGDNVDQYTNVNQPFPMPDSLQEFSVQTSNFSAEYGQNSGAIVNVVTKSGTNEFHGNLFEFVRNDVFNARNWASIAQDHIKRNQFGGTIGGPVRIPKLYNGQDKTFFFVGIQGTIFHYIAADSSAYVPTQANLNGDFSALLNPTSPDNPLHAAKQLINPQTKQPFPNNQIPTNLYDKAALNTVGLLPSATDATGFVHFIQPFAPQDFQEELVRLDHSISSNDRLTARYFIDNYNNPAIYSSGNILTYNDGQPNTSQNALIQEIHTFSPTLLNDARISFSRVDGLHVPPANAPDFTDLGVNMYQPGGRKAMQGISVTNLFSFGDHAFGGFVRNDYTFYDDFKIEKGRQNISLGGLVEYARFDENNQNGQFGSFSFSGDASGYSMSDFLLGSVRSFSQGSGEIMNVRNTFTAVYGEDSIRISPRFTLSLGLRYEPYRPWNELHNREEIFSPAAFLAGTVSSVYVNAPAGLSFPGDPGFPRGGTRPDFDDVAPRVGFAVDPFGNHKLSIRGGAGAFFNSRVISQLMQNTVDENPFSPSISLTTPAGTYSNPYLGLNAQSTPPFTLPAPSNFVFPLPISALTFDPTRKFLVPVTYQWNLTTEDEFAPGWLFRLAYAGSRGLHIRRDEQLNPVIYNAGAPGPYGNPALASNSRRTYMPNLTSIGEETESGASIFHSLQATLEKRLSRNFTILANYTWSKSLDDIPQNQVLQANGSGSFSMPIYEPDYNRFEYGPSTFDHANNFVASYVWQLSRMSGLPRYVSGPFGGWQWTGIVSAQTGDAFTAFAGTDRSLTNGNDRAIVSGSPYGGSACAAIASTAACKSWLNPASFSLPLPASTTPAAIYATYAYRFGNAAKGSLRGPGNFDWDMGLHKDFALRESLKLQFRAEFFNAFNHPNLSDPDTTMSGAGFGSITAAGNPRIGQMALKLNF
jgi:Carboxypeptidase regulatory-like domain